ncbi:MAG: HAD-IIIA family hydrolase [Clostridium sp.]|jgi:phosphoglycolate phosphatase|nr:HAD-IIIA family hydrolase [Clostridium sp.]
MFDAFLFDFDLTLANTSENIICCCNHALARMGHRRAAPEDILACVGKTVEESYAKLTGVTDEAQALRFHEFWREKANELGDSGAYLYPDVIPALSRLKKAGRQVAIVSNKTSHRIASMLKSLGAEGLVGLILGIELCPEPKPAPDGLSLALEKMGVPPEKGLYVGDSLVDFLTARAAGVSFAAVTTGTTTAEDFRGAGAERVFPSIGAIVEEYA